MNYRPEIDGLRAIAVIAIILFHTEIILFHKGFVGVDIFFVISGYLITGMIISKKEDASFSLIGFYFRRARRLLPALMLVLLSCIPFAFAWMFNYQLRDFWQSLIAANLFSSNILFWLESQFYFSDSSTLRPLLHTWSLAVEEQFYLVYPLVLLLLLHFGKRVTVIGIILTTVALAYYSQIVLIQKPIDQYYLPLSRVWLFGVGALAFFYLRKGIVIQIRVSEVLAAVGLAMMVLPITISSVGSEINNQIALSWWRNICIAGAWLVIVFANEKANLVGRLLSTKPLVGVGLISYSLYLWHYPVFVFFRIRFLAASVSEYIALITFSLFLSYLSWRYIESPFRNSRVVTNKFFLVLVVVASSFMLLLGSYSLSERPMGSGELNELLSNNTGLAADCSETHLERIHCKTHPEPNVLIWGDSFAMHIVDGILASKPNVQMIQATLSGCSPFLGSIRLRDPRLSLSRQAKECLTFNEAVLELIMTTESLEYVVISSRFSNYFNPVRMKLNANIFDEQSYYNKVLSEFNAVLAKLKSAGVMPVIIGEPRNIPMKSILCAAHSIKFASSEQKCRYPSELISDSQMSAQQLLEDVSSQSKVIGLDEFICFDEYCHPVIDGVAIYTRDGHLSKYGSAFIGKEIAIYDQIIESAK